MEIYAADLIGVRGKRFRLNVGVQQNHQGIGLLGSVRRILTQGILERVRHGVTTLDNTIELGTDMRITVDISPPESVLSSSGCDLPIAIVLLMAHQYHIVQAIRNRLEKLEKHHAQIAGKNSEKAADNRKQILEALRDLRQRLSVAQIEEKKLQNVDGRFLLVGKLNLDGTLEAPERGVFSMLDAAEEGMHIIVPPECEIEAGLIAKSKGGRSRLL